MKRLLVFLVVAVVSVTSSMAKDNNMQFGVYLNSATAINQMGVGAKMQFDLPNDFRIEPSFDYMFRHDDFSMWGVNLTAQYVAPILSDLNIYPILGVSYVGWNEYKKYEYKTVDDNFYRCGAIFGTGVEYYLNSQYALFSEVRYQYINDCSQFIFSLGFKF